MTQYTDDSFYKKTKDSVSIIPTLSDAVDALTLAVGEIVIPSTLDDLSETSTNKHFTSTLKTKLDGITGTNTGDQDLSGKVDKITGKGLSTEDFTTSEKLKLSGISSGATANDTDANLKNRDNHTGTQAISTVSGLQAALDAKQATITAGAAIADSQTDAPTNAATNLSADSVTILGISVPTNSSYAALVSAHNDLATKCNSASTKQNDIATKLNTLISRLEAQGILTP